jgi:hypothetical protein
VAAAADPAAEFAKVKAVIDAALRACHSAHPTQPASPPRRWVAFDTADQMRQNAEKIYKQVVQTKAMPLANLTNMTDAERAQIAAWYESGANEGTEMSKEKLAQWIDAHFDEEVGVLQQLLRVPTDTPPATMRRMRTWWPIWSRPTAGRREARGA